MSYRAFTKKPLYYKNSLARKTKAGHLLQEEVCNILSFYLSYCFFSPPYMCLAPYAWSWQSSNEKPEEARFFFPLLFIYLYFFFHSHLAQGLGSSIEASLIQPFP